MVAAATAIVRTVFLVVYKIQKPLLSHAHVSHKGKSGYNRHRGQEEGQRKRLQTVCGQAGDRRGEGNHPWRGQRV